MARTDIKKLEVYKLSERIADEVWVMVEAWSAHEKGTVGRQLTRAADSIGASIAEGAGRGSFQDNRRFIHIARGSLNEMKHWLRCAYGRNLLSRAQIDTLKPLLDELAPS